MMGEMFISSNFIQNRPAIELLDVFEDPYNQNNLANDPKYAAKVKKLDNALKKWMKECGDKGQETEMDALNHMPGKIVKSK